MALPVMEGIDRADLPVDGSIWWFESGARRYDEMWLSGRLQEERFGMIAAKESALACVMSIRTEEEFDLAHRYGRQLEEGGFPFRIDYAREYQYVRIVIGGRLVRMLHDGENVLINVQNR